MLVNLHLEWGTLQVTHHILQKFDILVTDHIKIISFGGQSDETMIKLITFRKFTMIANIVVGHKRSQVS